MKTNIILRQIAIGSLVATAAFMPFSIRFCHWSYLLFILCWVIMGDWKEKWKLIRNNPLVWLMPLFFLIHLIAMSYTSSPATGWFQLEKKAAFLLIPLTLVSTPTLTRGELGAIVRVFIAACAIASLYCLAHAGWIAYYELPPDNFGEATMNEFLRLNPDTSPLWMSFSYISLASGIQMHPTYFGLYLVTCLLLMLFFFKADEVGSRERMVGRLIFVFFILFIFFLSSRIATVCAIAVSVFAIGLKLRQSWSLMIKLQAAVLIAFVFILYANPISRYRGMQEPAFASFFNTPDYASKSIEIRLSLLKLSSIAGSGTHRSFGSGTGTAEDRLRAAGLEHGISNVLGSYDPHNQFIYTFLELGVVGLLSLIAMIFIPAAAALRKKSRLYAGLAMVFFAVCLTESALELQKGIILFTFFGSLLLFHEMRSEPLNDRNDGE